MSLAWVSNGRLVLQRGRLVVCDRCPCVLPEEGIDTPEGTIQTTCCAELIPEVLYAKFSGSLAALGTVTLTYVAAQDAWVGDGGGVCFISTIRFECEADNFVISLGPTASCGPGPPDSCDPFVWTCSGTSGGGCSGTFDLTIEATP